MEEMARTVNKIVSRRQNPKKKEVSSSLRPQFKLYIIIISSGQKIFLVSLEQRT